MINALFRTQFESNTTPFIMFLAMNGALIFMLLGISAESGLEPPPNDAFHFIVLWLLIFLSVAVTMGLIRHNKEKRCRLYAQLPVAPEHVRLAYWCLAGLFIFISTGVLALVMLAFSDILLKNVVLFSLLYFFHTGVVLAVLSIVTSNNLPLIPEEIRRRTVVYFFMAALFTFLILFLLLALITLYMHLLRDGDVKWWTLTLIMALTGAGLVALDVRLFSRKEDYLG